MNAKPAVKTLNREEWLERALDVVSLAGGAKLRIDYLVKEIGVTKGSFYWHFNNRDDFVRNLIDYWHEHYTLTVSDYLDGIDGSAEEKMRKLMEMVFVEQLTRHDLAIRSWAIAEPELRELVKRTDNHRLKYLRMLFTGMGFDKDGADLRAHVFLGEASWESALFETMTTAQRKKKAMDFFDLLVGKGMANNRMNLTNVETK
jgi:AcrR family transcriptional regulator